MRDLTITLPEPTWAVVIKLIDSVTGVENIKALMPVYEAIIEAAKAE